MAVDSIYKAIIIPLCRQQRTQSSLSIFISSVCMDDTYFKQFRCAGKSVLLNGKSGLIVSRFFDYYCELELARDFLLLMSGHLSGGGNDDDEWNVVTAIE